jgi:phage-related protein
LISTDFYFNNKESVDLEVYLVKMSTGFFTSPFLSDKEIIEEEVIGVDKPYFFGTHRKPLILNLTLSTLDNLWTIEKRREVARWLDTNTYELFYSHDDKNKLYYCQYIGGIDLNDTGSMQGYIEVQMRCDSPYAYSPFYETVIYDYGSGNTGIYEFYNYSDDIIRPEIEIFSYSDGNMSIQNMTDANSGSFEFTGLFEDEIIYVDCENEVITTSLANTYRYSSFNDKYLFLPRGINRLKINGEIRVTLRYQFKIKG